MYQLQFVPRTALRQRALPIGGSYAVDFAKQGKRQFAFFQSPTVEKVFYSLQSVHTYKYIILFRFCK